MRLRPFLLASVFLCLAINLDAQVDCNNQSCTFSLSFDDGLGPSPTQIRKAPWSGQEHIESAVTMSNGTHTTTVKLGLAQWRDSEGRRRTERHAYPESSLVFGEKPPDDFTVAQIRDAVSGYQYVLDPIAHVAHRMNFRPGAVVDWKSSMVMTANTAVPAIFPNGETVTHEALGLKPISGIAAVGVRNTVTRAAPSGNGTITVSTYDEWFDPENGARILRTEVGSDGNAITRTIQNYSVEEPDPNLFRVPSDYQIVDETGPFRVTHARAPGASSGPGAPIMTTYIATCNGRSCKVTVSPGGPGAVAGLTGAPYSGTPTLGYPERKNPDGTIIPAKSVPQMTYSRDSSGRFHLSHILFFQDTGPKPPNIDVEKSIAEIDDPIAGYQYVLDSIDRVAYRIPTRIRQAPFEFKPQEPGTKTSPNGAVSVTETLPPSTISGVTAVGYRVTHTYPPGTYQKNDKEVVLVDEFWKDPKTGVFLFVKVGNTTGYFMQTAPDYKQVDPDPSMFQIPDGYKIVDEAERFSFNVPETQ